MCLLSRSVMSDSLWPHELWPARLLCPWDSPGKNTGVGCHAPLQGIFPTQGWKLCLLHLLHCRQILYCWATREAPCEIFFIIISTDGWGNKISRTLRNLFNVTCAWTRQDSNSVLIVPCWTPQAHIHMNILENSAEKVDKYAFMYTFKSLYTHTHACIYKYITICSIILKRKNFLAPHLS